MRLTDWIRPATIAMVLAGLATPSLAQQPQVIQERGYVVGFGGAAFTDVSSPLFGGGVGFNLGPAFEITGEVGRMMDVTPTFTNEDLKLSEQGIIGLTGTSFEAKAKVPTTYLTAGARWLLPTNSSIRPYVMGSGGVAWLRPEPSFTFAGTDITSFVLEDDAMKTAFADQTRPLASIGGGVKMTVNRHLVADIAYRYSRIFISQDYLQDTESPTHHSGININRVFAGIGYQF